MGEGDSARAAVPTGNAIHVLPARVILLECLSEPSILKQYFRCQIGRNVLVLTETREEDRLQPRGE